MTTAGELLDQAEPGCHLVQFYSIGDEALLRNLTQYVLAGLNAGQAVVVFSRPARETALRTALGNAGTHADAAVAAGDLILADAAGTLARMMVGGHPDSERFDSLIFDTLRALHESHPNGVRAFGEMVGLLWQAGHFPAAVRLEQLWHRALKRTPFNLFCTYPIDIFGRQFDPGVVDALLSSHTHLLSTGNPSELEASLERATFDVLGSPVHPALDRNGLHPNWGEIPVAERTILGLRRAAPQADEILDLALRYYRNDEGEAQVAL